MRTNLIPQHKDISNSDGISEIKNSQLIMGKLSAYWHIAYLVVMKGVYKINGTCFSGPVCV